MIRFAALAVGFALAATAARAQISPYASAGEQQAALTDGRVTSEQLVRAYLERIERIDRAGPKLNAVLTLNPHALDDARRLDAERRAGKVHGPLHGVTILLKDNIETADGTATTAGSLALAANITGRDAPIVKRLTDAGAIVLGKTTCRNGPTSAPRARSAAGAPWAGWCATPIPWIARPAARRPARPRRWRRGSPPSPSARKPTAP